MIAGVVALTDPSLGLAALSIALLPRLLVFLDRPGLAEEAALLDMLDSDLPVTALVQLLMAEAMRLATVDVEVLAVVEADRICTPLTVMLLTVVLPDPPIVIVVVEFMPA